MQIILPLMEIPTKAEFSPTEKHSRFFVPIESAEF